MHSCRVCTARSLTNLTQLHQVQRVLIESFTWHQPVLCRCNTTAGAAMGMAAPFDAHATRLPSRLLDREMVCGADCIFVFEYTTLGMFEITFLVA